jgi:transposase
VQGRKSIEMPLFVSGNLSDFVPEGHLLRKVDKILDLSFVRELTKKDYCHDNGRPSLDPVVYFKLQIIAYLYGVKSDRRLCEEIQYNMAYRWYLGYPLDEETPNHSTLTRTRDRLGEKTFQKVFEKIVIHCQKIGLVKGTQIISDASLIKADASKNSIVLRESKKKDKRENKKSNATHVSQSDPESTMVGRPGYGNKLYYKVHSSIDGSSRVITDCHITTGAVHECNILAERIDSQIEKFNFPVKEVIADSGYGDGSLYNNFSAKKIRTYIPLRSKKLGKGRTSASSDFEYDKKNNRYKCAGGHHLYPYKPSLSFVRYRITSDACKSCHIRDKCFENQTVTDRPRYINRSNYQQTFDRVRKRMKSKLFKTRMIERAWKIEGIFGEAKTNHGMRRARYRGLSKMQIQLYMISTVQNIKRILGHFVRAFIVFLMGFRLLLSFYINFTTAK